VQWAVNGLQLAGLSWGSPGEKPLLALHGWLDNAASFAALAPLLRGYHVVALDLTGHGQSDWRSADASYQIWDDLPEILGVVDQLGWKRFDLLGHSRGAIISMLLAASGGRFPGPVAQGAGRQTANDGAQQSRLPIDRRCRVCAPGRRHASRARTAAGASKPA
jgi:pimeloyl-ACP methyl ester carboxylesterase